MHRLQHGARSMHGTNIMYTDTPQTGSMHWSIPPGRPAGLRRVHATGVLKLSRRGRAGPPGSWQVHGVVGVTKLAARRRGWRSWLDAVAGAGG